MFVWTEASTTEIYTYLDTLSLLDALPISGIDALAPLLDALADVHVAPAEALPATGVGLELERMLSPAFVRDARYGTRCSSVVLVGDGGLVFAARRFGADDVQIGRGEERGRVGPVVEGSGVVGSLKTTT